MTKEEIKELARKSSEELRIKAEARQHIKPGDTMVTERKREAQKAADESAKEIPPKMPTNKFRS